VVLAGIQRRMQARQQAGVAVTGMRRFARRREFNLNMSTTGTANREVEMSTARAWWAAKSHITPTISETRSTIRDIVAYRP